MKPERPKVYSIAIEVTAHCQQKCDYCYNAWREDNGAGMEAGTSKRLLARVDKLLRALDVDHVTVTGGEPFAHRNIFELLELVKSHGVGIQIISNGGLIDDRVAERLATLDVHYVQVTLDGSTKELHERHVGEGHFEPTLEGIRALRRHGVPVVGCCVVTKENASDVGAVLGMFKELGARQIALSRFSPAGYAARHVAELLPSRDDLLVAFRQAIPFARGENGAAAMHISCTMPVPPCAVEVEELEPLKFGTCAIGTKYQEFALGPDGRIRHCTLHGKPIAALDVLDDAFDPVALVSSPEVTEYKRTLPEFCEGCIHAGSCGGGCGAAAEWVLGSRKMPDPFVWQHVDDAFADQLANAPKKKAVRRLEIVG